MAGGWSGVVSGIVGGVLSGSLITGVFTHITDTEKSRETGLVSLDKTLDAARSAEIAEITADAASWTITGKWQTGVNAAITKNRNDAVLSIHSGLAGARTDHLLRDCVYQYETAISDVVDAPSDQAARSANASVAFYLHAAEDHLDDLVNTDSFWRELRDQHGQSDADCPKP